METKRYYDAACGAFETLIDPNETFDLKQEAEEGLIKYSNDFSDFKEQSTKAYKDITEKIVLDSETEKKCIESLKELNRVGVKMGIAEELSEKEIKSKITVIKEKAKLDGKAASTSLNRQPGANRQYKYNPNNISDAIDEIDEVSTSSGKNKKSGCCGNQSRCCLLI